MLLALHIGVLILFPYYPPSAPLSVFVIFVVSSVFVIGMSALFSLLWLSKSIIFSSLFDLAIVIGVSILLLVVTPQSNDVSPADKLLNGNFPTKATAEVGWYNFVQLFSKDTLGQKIAPTMEEMSKGINVLKKAVKEERNNIEKSGKRKAEVKKQ